MTTITEATTIAELSALLEKEKLCVEGACVFHGVTYALVIDNEGEQHKARGNTLAEALNAAYALYTARPR
jgi:hypothetical protein